MVEDPRAALRPHRIRQLKGPAPCTAILVDGVPRAIRSDGRYQPIETILDRWRVDDEWWTDQPVSRWYFEVLLRTGRKLIFWLPSDQLATPGETTAYPSPE